MIFLDHHKADGPASDNLGSDWREPHPGFELLDLLRHCSVVFDQNRRSKIARMMRCVSSFSQQFQLIIFRLFCHSTDIMLTADGDASAEDCLLG